MRGSVERCNPSVLPSLIPSLFEWNVCRLSRSSVGLGGRFEFQLATTFLFSILMPKYSLSEVVGRVMNSKKGIRCVIASRTRQHQRKTRNGCSDIRGAAAKGDEE